MKKITTILLCVAILMACTEEKQKTNNITVNYPETKTVDTVDTYFDIKIKDPYRWLEDDRSEETGAWVTAENNVTFDYLSKIPYREQLKTRLSELWNYEKVGAPFKEGAYTYFYKNDG